ncbi:MAG TPA: hypothetical protein GX686_04580 [Paracoccus sp.]|nr:hypothetical protein [Paracoccus sp. (in: a-proteobacteria)]
MARLPTNHIAMFTKLHEPHKVLERPGGKPVAILLARRGLNRHGPRRVAPPGPVMA